MEDPVERCERARMVRVARQFYEPVAYLEALATLRLTAHEDIEPEFEDAGHEWLFREWGWGAHLSGEATLRLIAALRALRLDYPDPPVHLKRLLDRLEHIEQSFAGIPRVPTTQGPPLAPTVCSTISSPETHATPCFGGTVAWTHRVPSGALGTLSRFPLLPALPLARQEQAYPVLFWQSPSDYGFLQWRIAGERVFTLPGSNDADGLFPFPETHALQRGGEALVLRLYRVPPRVTRVEDRWEGVGQARLAVRCLPLLPGVLATERLALDEGKLPRVFVTLWALSLEGEITQEPVVAPVAGLPSVPRGVGEEALDIDWELPGGLWQVRIDPLEKEPLRRR